VVRGRPERHIEKPPPRCGARRGCGLATGCPVQQMYVGGCEFQRKTNERPAKD
jgi:hypothetical protein